MADKTFDKCSKCRVTNLMEATVCRNCKTPLPWAASASSAPVAPVSFDPLSASPAATTVAITTSNTQSSTQSRTRSQSATSSFVQDPNKPPQVYQGAPPSRDGYEAKKPAMNPAPFYAVGAIAALLALFFVTRMLAPAPTQAIENLEAHTTKDNVFACQEPVGWDRKKLRRASITVLAKPEKMSSPRTAAFALAEYAEYARRCWPPTNASNWLQLVVYRIG